MKDLTDITECIFQKNYITGASFYFLILTLKVLEWIAFWL